MKPTGRQIINQFKLHVKNYNQSRTFLQYLEEAKQRAIDCEEYEWAQRLHNKIESHYETPKTI